MIPYHEAEIDYAKSILRYVTREYEEGRDYDAETVKKYRNKLENAIERFESIHGKYENK